MQPEHMRTKQVRNEKHPWYFEANITQIVIRPQM